MKFKTHPALTLLLAGLAGAFAWLGAWQLDRGEQKRETRAAFDAAPVVARLSPNLPPWTRIRLEGRLDPARHLLLDNRLFRGRPGVHVLTPFATLDGGEWVLVNRGWLPLPADRSALPPVPTPTGDLTLTGRLAPISRPGVEIGEPVDLQADEWPQLILYPDWARIETALGRPLHHQVLYLDPDLEAGFEDRNWTPFTMGPDRHQAYAVQWFGLALTAVVIWLVLGLRAGRQASS